MTQKFVIPTPKNPKNEYKHDYVHKNPFLGHFDPQKGPKMAQNKNFAK